MERFPRDYSPAPAKAEWPNHGPRKIVITICGRGLLETIGTTNYTDFTDR
ncbi:hypothetical protein EM6_0217 [Asticcacaulis excentricus]|uniref:Uncharacterized protein n=1 Tax=Asticcacaulis excentricus TaxID=78587 RepID=A0A3G9G5Y9_9CAUL|nr:hypothetical protein EM6_0217 [Asticcacaulis excentricus]